MIYLVIALLILFCHTVDFGQKKDEKFDRVVYFSLFLILSLIAGLRYRVGGDSLAYQEYFYAYPNLSQLRRFSFGEAQYRPLWYILNATIKSINDSFILFQFVQAIFVNGVIFWFIKRYCKAKYEGILFYFIFGYTYFNMEILRESFPVCIFLLSVPYLLKKKWLLYYLFSIIAFFFHFSAVITFVIPFLTRRLKIWHIILLILLVFVPFLFINPYEVFSYFNYSSDFGAKVETYTSLNINGYGVLMQVIAILPVAGFKILRQKCKIPPHVFENLMTAYLVIGIFAAVIGGFARFLNYLNILSIIYIVDSFFILKKYKKLYYTKYLWSIGIVFIMFGYQTYYYCRDTSRYQKDTRFYDLYLPYYSVFNPVVDRQREMLYFKQMGLY